MAYFGKEFKFEREENFEDFVNSLGLTDVESQNFLNYKPSIKVVKNGDSYTMYLIGNNRTREVTFTPGKEFKEDMIGRESSSVHNVDGDTFTLVQDFGAMGKVTYKRIFSENKLITELSNTKWDSVAYRYYVPA